MLYARQFGTQLPKLCVTVKSHRETRVYSTPVLSPKSGTIVASPAHTEAEAVHRVLLFSDTIARHRNT